MVGRARELAALRQSRAAVEAGTPHGVVIAGEAGIGKTRLLDDFTRTLPDDVVVARGQCVAMGSIASPFAPLRGVLRDLVAHFGADALLTAAGPAGRLLPAVLPELAEGPAGEISQEQLHDAVSLLLEGLSASSPLVVIVEDVHWADVPSLDLLRSLLHTLRRGRVLVVLSYRTDDVGRGHPLQPFLVELDRARSVAKVELTRLSSDETLEQVRLIRGTVPEAGAVAALIDRSDGIPFFVEELLALETGPEDPLPSTLRELVLARYARLGEATQAVLRLVAAGGVTVEHALVEWVHGGDRDSLDAGVREAIAGQVLLVHGSAYSFRHALTQEAVHDELLPGERSRFHARYAEALEADDDRPGRWAEIAGHWLQAHAQPKALGALVAASREAHAAGAPGAAGQLGEQALELWPHVADAEERSGCTRARLFLEVATAYEDAADVRAIGLLEEALGEVPPEDVLGRALLQHELVVARHDMGVPGEQADHLAVLASLPADLDDEAEAVRARVHTGMAVLQMLELQPAADAMLQDAVAISRALMERTADPEIEERARFELVRGLTSLGSARAFAGDVDGGLAVLDEALTISRGDAHARLRHAEQSSFLLLHLGRFAEAARVASDSRDAQTAIGTERGWGALISIIGALAHLGGGELAAAAAILRRIRSSRPPVLTDTYSAVLAAELAMLRDEGSVAAAELHAARDSITSLLATDPNDLLWGARVRAERAYDDGDLAAAWAQVAMIWQQPHTAPGAAFSLIAMGARTLASLRGAGLAPQGTTDDDAERQLRETFERIAIWEVADDWRALIDAELGGGAGTGDDPALWRDAADAAARGRLPVAVRAHALQRLAESRLGRGDRDGARGALDEVTALAEAHDLRRAGRLAAELAQQAGLALAGPPAADSRAAPAGGRTLTSRERQVLQLVAEGLTNRQIGERLFISDKTASVHVSAILRKLGASGRAEAAARAAELLV
ncbi:helix-turn-helix transcriptional regulator [Agrococcus baldri]|nr:AAA family ATPase [Agrococcus baldri]